nr:MAG TPA: hypothetical protein [Caudoviricetes sp.]
MRVRAIKSHFLYLAMHPSQAASSTARLKCSAQEGTCQMGNHNAHSSLHM